MNPHALLLSPSSWSEKTSLPETLKQSQYLIIGDIFPYTNNELAADKIGKGEIY